MGSDITVVDTLFSQATGAEMIPAMIGFIVGCLLAAFFSFRFFKLMLILSGFAFGYAFGTGELGMLLGDRITAFNAPLVLGIACAVVFAILMPKFYKFCIHLFGGILGFIIGYSFCVGLLIGAGYRTNIGIIGIVAGVLLAVFCAKLVYRFFKPYFIVSTSLLGSLLASIVTCNLIFGDSEVAIVPFAILGLVLAIIAMRVQFRMNRDRTLDL